MQGLPQEPGQALAPGAVDDPNAKRACDQCRLRKIRCDKESPCANCRISKRSCTSTGAGQRPKEQRQRILISSKYERKIDQLDHRLSSIESLLRDLVSSRMAPGDQPIRHMSHSSSSVTPGAGSSDEPTRASTADPDTSGAESDFGGDEGFTTQTTFASEFLESAVERTSLHDSDAGIAVALGNLRQLVEVQKRRSISHGPRFPLQKPLPPGGLTALPLPPMEAVVPLLKRAQETRPTLFTLSCALMGIADFSSLCQQVYFPTKDVSHALFAIVNSGLYNLFNEEISASPTPALRTAYEAYAELAQANLETYLANLPMFLNAKIENVQALLLGAQYAIDLSKPSVAWYLNTMAAQLCQAAGFHRIEALAADNQRTIQIKGILFWQVYLWDRGLGLRLGRAPVIQECDITIPFNVDFTGFLHLEESAFPRLWLRISMLQGRIYKELYSPAALKEDPAEIGRRARDLAVECRSLEPQVMASREETKAYLKSINSTSLVEVFIKGDEVQFLTTLTLVYRAIPAPDGSASRFCIECLETARKTLREHHGITLLASTSYVKAIHVHWNLMLTPFAPFFVLFCHVIETLAVDDLELLQEFVASLEPMRDASQTADKLYRVFQLYCEVAVVYIGAKKRQQEDQSLVSLNDEMDMYLGQLGFMPMDDPSLGSVGGGGNAGGPMPMGGGAQGMQTAQMASWLTGSRDMLELLESDLPNMDGSRWMPPGSGSGM